MMLTRVAAILLLLWSTTAQSNEDADRFVFNVGAFYLDDSETEISVRSVSLPVASTINFERDLNGEERVGTPRIAGYYRFNARHRLDYEWFRLEREGFRVLGSEITFRDRVFPVGADVASAFHTELTKLAYTWSFHHDDAVELGLSVGLYLLDYEIALRTQTGSIATDASLNTPLPMLGFRLDYTIGRRWHALLDVETFYIEIDDDTRGSIDDFEFALEYRLSRRLTLGLSTNRLVIDAAVNDDGSRWRISDLYRGEQIHIGVRF